MSSTKHTFVGYGGSRGGAKSHAERAVMLIRRGAHPGTRGCIFRRTFEKVRENHIEPLFNQYPYMRDWYNTQNKELTLPNKSVIAFRYAENPGDVDAFIGKEYMDFFVDQAEQMNEKELITLKSCCRWPGVPDHQCKFVLTFNPGNIGHAFLKRIFSDKNYHDKERPEDYVFLQAYGWDNIEWARTALAEASISDKTYYREWTDEQRFKFFIEHTQYGRELDALPQAMRIGWLLGSMDQFAGQYFDIFERSLHVARLKMEDWFPRWIGIDWGFGHDSTAHWNARTGRQTYAYRELAANKRPPRVLAQEIVEATPREERSSIDAIYLSHDAFAQRTSPETIALQMGEIFTQNGMPEPTMEDRDPVGGAALMYEMLRNGELIIDPGCKQLIEVIPMITRDEEQKEKTVKFEGDDAFDSERIALKMRFAPRNSPIPVQIEEKVAEWRKEHSDRTSEMIYRAQLAHQMNQTNQPIRFAYKHR